MLRLICAVCLAVAPLAASSQMIYKIQMPDGSVMFSDTVPTGGKVLEEREAKNTPRVTTLPAQPAGKSTPAAQIGATPQAPTGVTRPGAVPTPMQRAPNSTAKPGGGIESVSTLERELAVARRKLDVSREPLPGERRGLAGGGSRLTPEYEARIAGMEREVAETEAKLKRAYESR